MPCRAKLKKVQVRVPRQGRTTYPDLILLPLVFEHATVYVSPRAARARRRVRVGAALATAGVRRVKTIAPACRHRLEGATRRAGAYLRRARMDTAAHGACTRRRGSHKPTARGAHPSPPQLVGEHAMAPVANPSKPSRP